MARRLSFCCLLLFAFAGSTVAQNDPQYVIKRRTDAGSSEIHYLAHVKVGDNWVLQDATTFSPNCVWYSGNTFDQAGVNHNYYFVDEGVYHFLYAPLTPKSPLHLSDSIPSAQLLRNSEQNYYFWDWDWDNKPIDGAGLTRGVELTDVSQEDCGFGWGGGECWKAYWVEYNDDDEGQWGWRLSSSPHYTINNPEDPVPGAARFRKVTVIPHDIEVTNVTEGELGDLADFTLDVVSASQSFYMTADTYTYDYIPAFTTYVFEGGTHNYYNNTDYLDVTPDTIPDHSSNPSSYTWTITGPGAEFLSFSSTPGSNVTTFEGASSTLYYSSLNETGHKTATLTFTVTYTSGITQVRTATVTVKTPCGNPLPVGNPQVVYDYVTVSWVNTADEYKIGLRKNETGEPWKDTIEVSNVSSYTFSGLEYETAYQYRVTAKCNGAYLNPPTNSPYVVNFTTMKDADLLIYGSVFGGGRMADVNGNTEVIIINCDTIGAVYGGNDIAGSVLGLGGSNVILGIDASTASDSYAQIYNGGQASVKVRVNDVYGGGNGYYSYNGSTFEAATADYPTVTIAPGASVTALSSDHQWDEPVWTNPATPAALAHDSVLTIPSIVKAAITVSNDQVKIDSLFGGAKNAFLTHIIGTKPNGDPIYSSIGDTIAINGGTILAVYGGNNIGGSQGYGRHRIHVTNTTTHLDDSIRNTVATGFGRDFGIRYLFGGGNKVAGSTTDVTIVGGQLDTIFGGGNEADVYAANVEVNCEFGSYSSQHPYIYGAAYSNAINSAYYTDHYTNTNPASFNDVKMIDTVNYEWNGFGGIYNVRTLFGGSNQAAMNGVPTVRLISGSIGTVYGGGNAGDMLSHGIDSICLPEDTLRFKYGTHVVMNDPTVLVDYLYGGCQVSNVDFSTWVEIQNGHVGYVYGGCNVSGDVGSTRINTELPPLNLDDPSVTAEQKRAYCLQYQQVQGATYVVASGGIIYKNLFAGSNGYYHCNDNVTYIQGSVTYGDPEGKYLGLTIPTHNETHAVVRPGANVRGNVYAGGNLACVGFTTQTVGNMSVGYKPFPDKMVGLASVRMDGGTVKGDVYGGGNMASIFGSNEVQVSGGIIGGALYGGNDKLGMVAQPTNRALPDKYFLASDGNTPLKDVKTYVSVTGRPEINTVYGGGNGDYDNYTSEFYCNPENLPIQRDIFVDINIDGYPDEDNHPGGHIQTVYGGGNGVTVLGKTTVFLNVKGGENGEEPIAYDHVDTIFGGNNKGHLNILADIILLKGQVNTVYGGCNKGAMISSNTVTGIDGTEYTNVGSVVRLRDRYTVTNTVPETPVTTTTRTTGRVSGTVYGGCRMNGVNNNSLVLVEGGIHGKTVGDVFQYATIYAGSDISGDVGGLGQVVISEDTENNYITKVGDVYGGGNGNYNYTSGAYQGLRAPYCDTTHVEMKGGTANNLYAGGYAGECGGTTMQVDGGTVNNRVFGGGNMAGLTTSNYITTTAVDGTTTTTATTTWGTSTVTVNGGEVKGGIFGGNNLAGSIAGDVNVNIYGGTLGTNAIAMTDGIFGGGFGENTQTDKDVFVTIGGTVGEQTYVPTIYGDVYGGSALGKVNTNTNNLTKVDFKNGELHGNLFGGGMGCLRDETDPNNIIPAVSALVKGNAEVSVSNGTLLGNIYGGCNLNGTVKGNITVDLTGGTIGNETMLAAGTSNVFGGGFGSLTSTVGNVTVNFGTLSTTHTDAPKLYGDLYGGSGYGNVNTNSSNSTTVNVLNGYVVRDVYGGGLGDANNPAAVNGKVFVNVGTLENNTLIGKARIDGSVYGCNNVNGSPQDDVLVNIYATHHWGNNAYPDTQVSTVEELGHLGNTSQYFALRAVYGGGNKAHYRPEENKMTTVHVWGCKENTIEDLYGGGNAADVGIDGTLVVNTQLIVDGGRIHRSFGGGNGDGDGNPGANIYGTASSYIYGGLIDEVYGGSNKLGSIDIINLNVSSSGNCEDEVFGKVFGCANAAPLNHSVTTTIGCPVGEIGDLYGGSYQASIGDENHQGASVTLNVYGGHYEQVFGGSRGKNDETAVIPADIWGDVTLNLYGGTIIDAFGGSDVNGTIKGVITVNVLDYESACPLDVTNIYGACNETAYVPDDVTVTVNGQSVTQKPVSPVVNVMHIKKTATKPGIRGNVFGGGKLASVTANPKVNIGFDDATMSGLIPQGYPNLPNSNTQYTTSNLTNYPTAYVNENVYGGGELGAVIGTDTVIMLHSHSHAKNLYGGGNQAGTTNTVINVIEGTVTDGIYGGCDVQGTVSDDVEVNIYGGVLGTSTTPMVAGIFGGGRGGVETSPSSPGTKVNGTVTVTIDKLNNQATAPTIYADVYGGSAFGQVGATDKLTKVDLKNGTIHGTLFGGGMGDANHSAEVTGDAELAIAGNVTDGVYGGCNVYGIVKGNTIVGITDGTIGVQTNADRGIVYGGGLGQNTKVKGDVDLTVDGSSVNIYGDVYGGSAKGLVNCKDNGNEQNGDAKTDVTLNNGTIHGDLYGGGHGLEDQSANVWGPVDVEINGGTVVNVYGGNNVKGTPKNTITVTVNDGTVTSVFGGGEAADYAAPATDNPFVYIKGGTVSNKVVGGGNRASIEGSPYVLIEGGNIGTGTDSGAGIYGGCNTSGIVSGNTKVELIGGTIGVSASNTANIHGGGYGQPTSVSGNVLVLFGDNTNVHSEYPMLFGDLYGGSALGNVNTNGDNTTTVNLRNGTINGGAYGGGLGRQPSSQNANDGIKALVNGVIHVNVGAAENQYVQETFTGKADLVDCVVYGGNNLYGSAQQNVYVDVYQTHHTTTNMVDYTSNDGSGAPSYAIHEVFGGGNRADYEPTSDDMKAYVYIHMCENTVERVFGGSNAASAPGVELTIDGGRFDQVYGGGNGEEIAANIGTGGIYILIGGGYIHQLVNGSNDSGEVMGTIISETMTDPPCSDAVIEDYFLGTNHTDLYEDINATIYCGGDVMMRFVNLYCGSNKAQIHGNINVTIEGGVFEHVYGGSKGDLASLTTPGNHEDFESNIYGDVNLTITGGTIGDLYGGCDVNGNITGRINVEVFSADNDCGLFIGNIYGAANLTNYVPTLEDIVNGTIYSPKVKIIKGTIGGPTNELPINNPTNATTTYAGNVFGGANHGYVDSNPKVIVGNGPTNTLPVTIKGEVYGGGNEGDVTGSPVVVVVPDTHGLVITQPESTTIGMIKATNGIGQNVANNSQIGEDLDVHVKAIPNVYGKKFDHWVVGGAGARVANTTSATTLFTMGTAEATLEAIFVNADGIRQFNYTHTPTNGGTVKVYNGMGFEETNIVPSGSSISIGAELDIRAIPNPNGYRFDRWEVVSGNGTIANLRAASTTFTMGSQATEIKAIFVQVTTHTLTINTAEHGSFTVKDGLGNTVSNGASIGEGTVLYLNATPEPNTDYRFKNWTVEGTGSSVGNANSASTTFTMGTNDSSISATFEVPSEPGQNPQP